MNCTGAIDIINIVVQKVGEQPYSELNKLPAKVTDRSYPVKFLMGANGKLGKFWIKHSKSENNERE